MMDFVNYNLTCPISSTSYAGILTMTLNTILAAHCAIGDPSRWPEDKSDYLLNTGDNSLEYDFVVIGAGSSGSVVANRLSEIPQWKVLLVEAGGDPPLASEVPAFLFDMLETEGDWNFVLEENPEYCKSMKNKKCAWPRGKMLGGSSSINAMYYIRGNRKDYDTWRDLGNSGWGYEDVLKYFKKSENIKNDKVKLLIEHEKYHGKEGPLTVSNFHGSISLSKDILEAARELGHDIREDMHAEWSNGFSVAQATVNNCRRESTATAFLNPVKGRPNLHVVKNALATKINFDKSKKVESIDVELANGKKVTIKAKKEVVVSAGVVNTPQLLMLSGIGPKKHLREMGIDVVTDLPVGEGINDHFFTQVIYSFDPKEASQDSVEESLLHYLYSSKGVLCNTALDVVGFINTKGEEYPDVQYHAANFLPNDSNTVRAFAKFYNFNEDFTNQLIEMNKDKAILSFYVVLLNAKSRGMIKLRTNNPKDKPVIDGGYLSDSEDLEILLRGIEEVLKLEETKPFQRLKVNLERLKLEECDDLKFNSRDYWICLTRHIGNGFYHHTSSAKMGPDSDPRAVVNPRLEVRGVKGLRVADASIMPKVVSGNTNAACIMIGEKAADLIKEDWKLNSKEEL